MSCYDKPDRRYDPREKGYGHSGQWRSAFRQRMSLDEAREYVDKDSPYMILGVPEGSAWTIIKSAYRRMASKWHPDVCKLPEAETMMKRINGAFMILEDQFGKA